MSKTVEEFGARLQEFRELRKMSFKDLSAKSGVSENTIRNLEYGKSGPTLETLVALAGALSVEPKWFLSENDTNLTNLDIISSFYEQLSPKNQLIVRKIAAALVDM